ncbi:MAG: (d)CMP kinase [Acutalibacteraceae bacterium]|nr:(d)CMP kinase [Acutalibacteraceae bacterium]
MINIAIDGPAGAGKSSLSRLLAAKLGYIYVDTGALYRAVGLKFSALGFDTELIGDIEAVLAETEVDIRFIDGAQRVFLDGKDVSDDIRTPTASMMASAVSAKPPVRAFLLDMQRNLAKKNNVVMDGRDIGTVVLPDAKVKIFLTADVEARAMRRFKELQEKGDNATFDEVLEDMKIRDYNDSHRPIAPLKQADDAVLADTTKLSFDESLELLLNIVKDGTKE